MKRREFLARAALAAAVGAPLPAAAAEADEAPAAVRRLGRGINLGNALEAPREGEWGLTLEERHFELIRGVGFRSVRVPIRWSAHAETDPPYRIDPAFFQRIDWVVEQALGRGLAVVLNVHHYEELMREPDAHEPRLVAIWRQIARRYRDRPAELLFELLNEPNGRLTPERWNAMIPRLLEAIREDNPRRAVIVGPGQWNDLDHLGRLALPARDRMLIATFHYYRPFPFTHQGASWVRGSDRWLGTAWTGSPQEMEAIRRDFRTVADWSAREGRPVYLGEFGAYSAADMDSRVRWTRSVAREAERHGFAWAYWEFAAGFGVYDRRASAWREPLLRALLPAGG